MQKVVTFFIVAAVVVTTLSFIGDGAYSPKNENISASGTVVAGSFWAKIAEWWNSRNDNRETSSNKDTLSANGSADSLKTRTAVSGGLWGRLSNWWSAKRELLKKDEKSSAGVKAGDNNFSIESVGIVRTYILHVPVGYKSRNSYPLVIVYHGGIGTGEKVSRQLDFSARADERGFFVAYPDGVGNSWNDGRGTTNAAKQGVDDVQFTKDLITDIKKRVSVSGGRVYATGPSNGGMMTYRLACEIPGEFKAVAPVIASIPEPIADECAPSQPIRLLAINGTDDPLVPFDGGDCCGNPEGILGLGQGGRVIPVSESIAVFVKANRCSPNSVSHMLPPIVNDGTQVEKIDFQCFGASLVSYVVHGMGHTWPPFGGQIKRVSGPGSKNLNATEVILEFFDL